jgi:hypothetical protein
MKLTPMPAPVPGQPQQTTISGGNTEARARAIEILTKGAAPAQPQAPTTGQLQEHPVANANGISPEEMSAIKAPSNQQVTDNGAINEDTTQEASAEPAKPVEEKPKKDPALERQFQELARQERILRAKAQKQAQELKTQQDAIKAQEAALNARMKEYEQGYISKDRLKLDPLAALAEANLSYDELTQQLLNQQPKDPRVEAEIAALRNELKALRAANEEGQKSAKQQQEDSYKAAVRQIERDAENLVKQDPEAFEAIAKTKSIKDVVELIEQTWQKDGILLTVEEAAQEVENYLVEEGYKTVSTIDKIKKRLAQTNASTAQPKQETQQTPAKTEQTQPATMKTLTNAASSTRKLSAKERAILAFKGELKT